MQFLFCSCAYVGPWALLKSRCTPSGNECQRIEALHKQGQLC